MKLSKALLGAMLVGITVQTTTSCTKKDTPEPKSAKGENSKEASKTPDNCPACGLG